MTDRLQDKVALVTGAASGIGAAIARRFAAEGARVVLTDLDGEGAEREALDIQNAGGMAEGLRQDVTDEPGWEALVDDISARYGALHILVNNAGIVIPANVESTTLEDWRKVNAVNAEAVFMGCRAAVAVMKQCGGSIINISSIEGIVGEANAAAYNASKGAVRIFTKSAALHCAAQGYPIRVNSVHPGFILTPMVEQGIASVPEEMVAEMQERLQRDIPMGAMGEPEDIANGCLFLASEESKYMTGSELVIDGGFTCR